MAQQLVALDAAARAVDGRPPTPINPSRPADAAASVFARLESARITATAGDAALLADVVRLFASYKLPPEPPFPNIEPPLRGFDRSARVIRQQLIDALAELDAYTTRRTVLIPLQT